MVRLCVWVCECVYVCLCTIGSIQGTVQRSHGGQRCLSPLPTHSPTLRAAFAFFFAHRPRTSFTSASAANGQGRELIWNQYLATASQSVWSPTSFSASVGRKWPNTPAPVLRWTHCCHIKAQICTVAQLKFPTLPLRCTPSPTPF